jgi:hypothetical protein
MVPPLLTSDQIPALELLYGFSGHLTYHEDPSAIRARAQTEACVT